MLLVRFVLTAQASAGSTDAIDYSLEQGGGVGERPGLSFPGGFEGKPKGNMLFVKIQLFEGSLQDPLRNLTYAFPTSAWALRVQPPPLHWDPCLL